MSGSVNVIGAANSSGTVTVNPQSTTRKGEYFRGEISADNSAAAVWLALTNIGVLSNITATVTNDMITTNTGYAFHPQTPESFLHDADGNLTNDGRWAYPTGTSTFRDWLTGTHPHFTVTMIGNSSSAALPSFFYIDYNYDIQLDFA